MVLAVLISMLVLILLGVPIAIALGLSAVIGAVFVGGYPMAIVAQKMFAVTDSFTLLAIPLFILAGFLMDTGGLSERIVRGVSALIGFVRGGLGVVSVVTCMLFSGVSGSAVADAAAVGSVIIRPMKARGYGGGFAASLIGSGSTVGPIIPPSIPFIIFGVATGTSITDLFLAGVLPGLLIGLALIAAAYVLAVKRDYPREPLMPLRQILCSLADAVPALFLGVIIIGGILMGIFTTTEASVVAVVYALLLAGLVYRSLTWAAIYDALVKTIDGTVMIMWLIATASLLSWLLTIEQVPEVITAFMLSLSTDPVVLHLLIAFLYLIIGTFMDLAPAILMLVPIMFPVIKQVGIDPVHFGVVTVVALAIGLITPPTAPTLMITANIAQVRAGEAFREIPPFLLAMCLALIVIVLVPGLSLWLPQAAR